MSVGTTPRAELEPQPPLPPEEGMCCESGCQPCVWDLYRESLDEYRAEHAAWQARQQVAQPGA